MSEHVSSKTYLSRLWVLMLTVFVDMMGFLIVLPLLVFYGERFGATPTEIGALVAMFAAAQLATSPLWGRMSDRYGRRPMILSGLAMSAVAYVLFEQADTLWLLFVSRIFQGVGAGTNGVVQAYLSDSVPAERRTQAFGWLTSAASAGVLLGPALGALAMSTNVGPGYMAAGLCFLNLVSAWFLLPEPGRREGRREGQGPKTVPTGATRRAFGEVFKKPRGRIGSLIWVYAAGMMAFMALNGVLVLYLDQRFGIDETTVYWFYVYVGGVSLIMRSIVLGPAVRWVGEVRLLRIGALAIAAGMTAMPAATNLWQFALAVTLVPIGTAFLFPTGTSLLSRRAAVGETGSVLGVQQSIGGVARMTGPLWAGFVFQHLGIRSPFWIGAGLMVLASFFTAVVRDEGDTAATPPDTVIQDAPS